MDRAETYRHIAAQTANGEITLPSSVKAALRLQAELDEPEFHMEDALKLVAGEPQLAARVVALANSAAFKRNNDAEVTGVRAALMRVGYKSLRTMVASLIVKQLGARIADPKLRAVADRLWLHSANVAALAHVLARRVTGVDPDTAMFAGIVHEVGGLYFLTRAEEYPGLLDDEPQLWHALCEEVLTRAVLAQLLVPEPVAGAILQARAVQGDTPPADVRHSLAATLVLANQFALSASPLGVRQDMPGPGDSPLEFVTDSGKLSTLIDESTDELRSMIAVLTS